MMTMQRESKRLVIKARPTARTCAQRMTMLFTSYLVTTGTEGGLRYQNHPPATVHSAHATYDATLHSITFHQRPAKTGLF